MSKDNTAPVLPFSRLPELLGETLQLSLASFLDAKLALFGKEVWEEGQSLLRGALGVATAGVVALVGFMVLTAALISSLATRIGNLPLSCLIIGGVYFVLGAGMAVVLAKNVTGQPLHKTQIELEKDKQWIKQTGEYIVSKEELQNGPRWQKRWVKSSMSCRKQPSGELMCSVIPALACWLVGH